MSNFNKLIDNCKHPNSRKTVALVKRTKREKLKNVLKLGQCIKQNIIGEKIMWFKNNLIDSISQFSKIDVFTMIQNYLCRFDEELNEIKFKNSIGGKRRRQHASREDIINMTKEREKQEFEGCGLEIPDLMDSQQVEFLKLWNGELRFIQNFKLKKYNKRMFSS